MYMKGGMSITQQLEQLRHKIEIAVKAYADIKSRGCPRYTENELGEHNAMNLGIDAITESFSDMVNCAFRKLHGASASDSNVEKAMKDTFWKSVKSKSFTKDGKTMAKNLTVAEIRLLIAKYSDPDQVINLEIELPNV